jgi:trehalose 6-phosphate synthase
MMAARVVGSPKRRNLVVKVIIVSNRVARAKADEPVAGGLAAALLPIVKEAGAIWVGSSGQADAPQARGSFAKIEALGSGALATVDMPPQHYRGYYEGFANSALWPALHSRPDLIEVTSNDYLSYCEVNAFMARALLRFTGPDAVFWIHDYHFLTLGAEMRRLQIGRPIGFFLHTPWSDHRTMSAVPHHCDFVEAMLAYDIIGFQTDEDRENFEDYVEQELGLAVTDGVVASDHGLTRLATFPIGIDATAFAERATEAAARREVSQLQTSLQGAKLVLGVDRLDYSKGLANRMLAFERLLEMAPSWKRAVALLQVAVPSRPRIRAYRELKAEIASLVADINGRHGEADWMPIRYLNKGFSQNLLAGFYRLAHVGLVTPLHDGMNLVAKEYIAAQNPFDPGVLVLSSFAGAAKELDAALLVNPHDIDGTARQIAAALAMPLDERRERWQSMFARLRAKPAQAWFADFIQALEQVRRRPSRLPTVVSSSAMPYGRAAGSTGMPG